MAGGWDTSQNFANAAALAGTGSTGTTLTSSATVNTKGAWTQIIASTAADYDALFLCITMLPGSQGSMMCIDLAVAASGNESNGVVFQNVLLSGALDGYHFFVPFPVPAGSRIAMRYASGTASDAIGVGITGFAGGYGRGLGSGIVDTYGYSGSGSPIGIAVDPGATSETKGAYAQLTASTTHDLAGFFLGFDIQNHLGGASSFGNAFVVDIAIGASGSEKIILPDTRGTHTLFSGGADINPSFTPIFPITIPAGTRIAARALCSDNTASDRVVGVSLYGIRE